MQFELKFDNNINIPITEENIIDCLKIFIDQAHTLGYYNEDDLLNFIVKYISEQIAGKQQKCYLFNVSNEKIHVNKLRLSTLGIESIQNTLIDAEYYAYKTKQ